MQFSIEQPAKVTDQTVLHYIWTLIGRYRQRKEEASIQCILCEQKLIHLSIIILDRQPNTKLSFDLRDQCVGFVQKINRLGMENIKEEMDNGNTKFFTKAVDIIMLPQISKYITDAKHLGKLKVLTFNNLACIYNKSKLHMMALKAVSFALDLEEFLIKDNKDEEKYDIIPTYLNKAAILSQMNKHQKALEEIRKAKVFIEKIEKDVEKKMQETTDIDFLKRLEQKRHYGLYMKMLIHYNIGVQKQHQKLVASAISFYQQSKRLAILINNQFMTKKLGDIVFKLKGY